MNPFGNIAARGKMWGLLQDSVATLRDNPRRLAPDIMRIFVANKTPICMWGPPGARKTRYAEAIGSEVDHNGVPYQVIVMQPSTSDPTVIHGMFYTSPDADGTTLMKRSVPEVAEMIVDYYNDYGGYTVILIDEVTTCSSAQQAAMLGLLTHGKYGDLNIQPYTSFMMAANPEGTVSTVNPLSEAVINRAGHIAWYGDAQLFLEEWSVGFGHEEMVPEELTEWYIRTLIEGSMEKAFRDDDKWSVDDLVPYDQFTHSERTTTELAKIITYINNEFSDVNDEIRHYYIIKVTEALQGPDWAKRMATVCQMESRKVTAADLKKIIRSAPVTTSDTTGDLHRKIGNSMFVTSGANGSTMIDSSVIVELAEKLLGEFKNKRDLESYMVLWAFASTAPDAGRAALIHPVCLEGLMIAQVQARNGEITREQAIPYFVPAETKESVSRLHASL